jgi:hypothetical protein
MNSENKTFFHRQRAEAALGNAKEVVNALDEAEAAQNEARKAIQQASGDIGSAKLDLADVSKGFF